MVKYTIADFTSIKNNGFDFQLSPEVISILRDLHRHFKPNTEVIRQLNFKRTKLDFNKPTTVIREENKVNPFTAIKLLLNKVSPKNYLDCVDKLDGMVSQFLEEAEFQKVAELVFEIASTNRFYTSLYADIYSHLTKTTLSTSTLTGENFFYKHYETVYGEFLGMFDNMVYVNPDEDYDRFCLMNVDNEKRKALSTFLGCLMKNGIVPREHTEHLLRVLIEKIEVFITEPNRVNEVDEIVENINCIYSPAHHYDLFHPKLQQLSTIKFKQFPSISSKTLFKLQDIAKKPRAAAL
jgi:hypothetical protein